MSMKCYVIIAGTGEYSDRYTWPFRVYTDKAQAKDFMTKVDAIHQKYYKDLSYYQMRTKKKSATEAALAEYQALGFVPDDPCTDWCLEECELFQ